MTTSLSQLLEDSFRIAWEYLERTGELGDGAIASRFLSDTIEIMIRRGQRSRLGLSNRNNSLSAIPIEWSGGFQCRGGKVCLNRANPIAHWRQRAAIQTLIEVSGRCQRLAVSQSPPTSTSSSQADEKPLRSLPSCIHQFSEPNLARWDRP
jgi:hypothetical protein